MLVTHSRTDVLMMRYACICGFHLMMINKRNDKLKQYIIMPPTPLMACIYVLSFITQLGIKFFILYSVVA